MAKNISALLAAIIVTAVLAGGMYYLGNNALVTVDVIHASTQVAADHQLVVDEYQKSNAKCISEIKTAAKKLGDANTRIEQANQQVQQYQAVMDQLQQAGLITIAPDGTVTVIATAVPH